VNKHTCPTAKLLLLVSTLFVVAGLLSGTGCQSGPASASFASVTIPGKTPEEICQTAGAVFREDGYKVALLSPEQMVFEKEASRGESLAYSGVVDTHYGATTLVRVRAELVDLGEGSHRLQCQAYMVRNAGDSFFADESRLVNMRSRPYQNLLDKVAKRLK
jgi:hypothetical protein